MLLAQISDLHVRPAGQRYKDAVDSNRMLAEAIAHLNGLDPRPELVLITGDLVDEGLDAEYEALWDLLAALEPPFLLMPGNHDDRETLVRHFPEHAYLPPRGPKHYVVDRPPLRIVALDTTVPGDHHGEVDAAGLAWLETALQGGRGAPTVVLMHHPPFACGIPYLDRYMCRDPGRLEKVIGRFPNVERVLCGHVHRPILRRWAGTVLATCPSTATQIALRLRTDASPASFCEPPACLLHHWQDGAMVTHTSYIGRFEGPFPFA
ncbi:phosphodiesterase [Reyranella sp.]|uniref:phosphodiesterase n=1 Tax=Reyranella sp. TaxID=1929291 RepID=UPI003BA98B90